MHTTLINPPQAFSKSMVTACVTPPLGIAYLAAVAIEAGHKVKLIEALGEAPGEVTEYRNGLSLRGLNFREIIKEIPKETDLVGISNLFTFAFPVVLDLAKTIKEKMDVPIVLGGAHPSATPHETLKHDEIDYVIISEGEDTLIDLLSVLEGKKKEAKLDGFAWKEKGSVKVNPKTKLIENLDSIPFPRRDLLPMENYFSTKEAHGPVQDRWTPMVTSRGCPYECTFCTPRLWLRRYRLRSVENVINEIEECISDFKIREFLFEDENLTINKKRTLDLCNEIKKRKLDITWQTPNGIRASVTDEEMLVKMKESGCSHITVAPESGSERILNNVIRKHQNLEDVTRVVRTANKMGLKCAAFFIMGLPGENIDDLEKTIAYSTRLAKEGLDEVAFAPFIPVPGSELYDKLKADKKLDYKDYKFEDLTVMGDLNKTASWSEHISNEQLQRYRRKAYVKFHIARAVYHPGNTFRSMMNVLRGRQETKTERVIQTFLKRYSKKQG